MSTIQAQERITIGKVLKPRGIKGEVKVLPLTDIPHRFDQLQEAYIHLPASGQDVLVSIEQVRYYKGFVYLRFVGFSSIEAVEAFTGNLLQVDSEDVPALPEGVYYQFQILGLEVYTDQDRYLGTVTDILETGANDVYVVKEGTREYLIPSQKDIVTRIDLDCGRLIIHPMDGLLDL